MTSNRSPRTSRRIAALGATTAVLAASVTVALAAPAVADVEKRGSCGNGARYDFDVDRDDGHLEASFEVDSNVRGQQWRLTLFQNGNRVFRDVRTTDREGEVDFDRNRPDSAGADIFRATAKNLGSGQTCSVTIRR